MLFLLNSPTMCFMLVRRRPKKSVYASFGTLLLCVCVVESGCAWVWCVRVGVHGCDV